MNSRGGQRPVVQLTFDTAELAVTRLQKTTETFSRLLREVSRQVAPSADIKWVVSRLSLESPFVMEVVPVSSVAGVDPADLAAASHAIGDGISLVREGKKPSHFTHAALETLKDLAKLPERDDEMRVKSNGQSLGVDATVARNVDLMLGQTVGAIGTVEGRLEGLNVHGRNRYFTIYDELTGERIQCHFGYRVDASAVGAMVEKRVAAYGQITYLETGEIIGARVTSIEAFPPDDELPNADDVLGILEF